MTIDKFGSSLGYKRPASAAAITEIMNFDVKLKVLKTELEKKNSLVIDDKFHEIEKKLLITIENQEKGEKNKNKVNIINNNNDNIKFQELEKKLLTTFEDQERKKVSVIDNKLRKIEEKLFTIFDDLERKKVDLINNKLDELKNHNFPETELQTTLNLQKENFKILEKNFKEVNDKLIFQEADFKTQIKKILHHDVPKVLKEAFITQEVKTIISNISDEIHKNTLNNLNIEVKYLKEKVKDIYQKIEDNLD